MDIRKMRKQMREEEDKSKGFARSSGAVFPHWNIKEGGKVTLRFLPDGDAENEFFWATRQVINIPFHNKLGNSKTPVSVRVPCMHTYEESDSIIDFIKDEGLWKGDEDDKKLARKYYKKVSHKYHGFIVGENPIDEEPAEGGEIPNLRQFVFTKMIHKQVWDSIMDEENWDDDDDPLDYETGLDYVIKVSRQGEYNNYTGHWARKPRALDEDELGWIEALEKGIPNLAEGFVPKKPNEEEIDQIMDLFEASWEGREWTPEEFGDFAYLPFGYRRKKDGEDDGDGKPKKRRALTPQAKRRQEAEDGDDKPRKPKKSKDILKRRNTAKDDDDGEDADDEPKKAKKSKSKDPEPDDDGDDEPKGKKKPSGKSLLERAKAKQAAKRRQAEEEDGDD